MKRRLRILAFAMLGVLVLAGGFAAWLIGTESGLRFALARAVGATDGRLSLRDASGSLRSGFTLTGLRWQDVRAGADLQVAEATIAIDAGELLARRVHVRSLAARGLRAALTTTPPDPDAKPFDLAAPLEIAIDDALLRDAEVAQDGRQVLAVDELRTAARWDAKGVAVDRLSLRSPAGKVDLDGALALAPGNRGNGRIRFAWRAGERDYAGTIAAKSDGAHANLDVALTVPTAARVVLLLEPRGKWPWTASVRVPAFAPQRVLPDSTWESLALSIDGAGDEGSGRFSGELAIDARRFTLNDVRYVLDATRIEVTSLDIGSPDAAGVVSGRASLVRNDGPLHGTAALEWRDVVLPADLAGQALESHGAVALTGSTDAWHAETKLELGPPGKPNEITARIDGTPDELRFDSITLKQAAGALEGAGTLALGNDPRWDFKARATGVDPGTLLAEWPGSLGFELATEGAWTDDGARGHVLLQDLAGTLRGRAIAGDADVDIAPGWAIDGRAELRSGGSVATLQGQRGDATDATLVLRIASLDDLFPGAAGKLDARLRAQGRWPHLAVQGDANASALAWDGTRVERAHATFDVRDFEPRSGTVDLDAHGVQRGELAYESLVVALSGDESAHALRVAAEGEPAALSLELRGARDGDAWRGTLGKLAITPKDRDAFVLERPTDLAFADGSLGIGDACLAAGAARVCVASTLARDGGAEASYRVERLPLSLIAAYAAPDSEIEVTGLVEGNGRFARTAEGALTGDAVLSATPGRIGWPGRDEPALAAWSELRVDARRAADGMHATLRATLDGGGRVAANADVTGEGDALSGRIEATLPNVAFLELFTPELSGTKGQLEAGYALAGTLAQPRLDGALSLSAFSTELPTVGIRVSDGEARVAATGPDRYGITGSVHLGDGVLRIAGEGGTAVGAAAKLTLKGENLLLADVPGMKIVASPDLALERDAERMLLSGKLAVPSANIDLTKLPGGSATRASSDVVVIDAGAVEQEQGQLPFAADVVVTLGDQVKVRGYGLKGEVEGQLRVRERPSRPTTGTGELRVTGTYKAYGQNLTIDRGRLLFAESPLEDPGLDMVATRPLRDVTPGLRIQGRAQAPVLTVFATPPMEQSEALSYLVTGRPLRGLSNEQGSTVTMAAQALGAVTGDLLAKGIGKRIGVDDIGVSTDDRIGGSAFTIGKYLSPRLYLSYGVGLFTPGEIVTMRYEFTDHWDFEASTGSVENRAGVNYKYER